MNQAPNNSRFQDLWIRTISGAGLALIAFIAFFVGPIWSTLLLAAGAAIMLWEFHGMVAGAEQRHKSLLPLMVLLGAATVLAHDLMGGTVSLPLLLGSIVLTGLVATRRRMWMGAGVAYIVLSMAALVSLRAVPGYGFELVVWLILVVVAADIGGYFAGRLFGGPKLWPAVSPKKTWSGAVGGWVLALIVGIGFAVATGAAPTPVLLYSLGLAVVSQAGDLTESMVKRRFGVKDAGNFLPGHGGALDRFDGLMAAALASSVLGLGPELFQV